jgi:hypothetical protein
MGQANRSLAGVLRGRSVCGPPRRCSTSPTRTSVLDIENPASRSRFCAFQPPPPASNDNLVGETGFEPATARPPAEGMGCQADKEAHVYCIRCRRLPLSLPQFVPSIVPQTYVRIDWQTPAARSETARFSPSSAVRGGLVAVLGRSLGSSQVSDTRSCTPRPRRPGGRPGRHARPGRPPGTSGRQPLRRRRLPAKA